jgi:hypothetical protein
MSDYCTVIRTLHLKTVTKNTCGHWCQFLIIIPPYSHCEQYQQEVKFIEGIPQRLKECMDEDISCIDDF